MKGVDPKMAAQFKNNAKKLGDTPQAVHWGSEASARVRYESWWRTINGTHGKRVLDIGSGLGHLYEFAVKRGDKPQRWVGVEMEKSFIEMCNKKFENDETYRTVEQNFMDAHQDIWILDQHFHLAVLMGSISLVAPKDLPKWLTKLESMNIDCFMIEFLRKGVSKGPFHKYDLQEVKKMFDKKEYEYHVVFHELPHVFNVYAFPKRPVFRGSYEIKLEAKEKVDASKNSSHRSSR